jgi:hypothetical protein
MTIDSSCGLRHAAWRVVQTFPNQQVQQLARTLALKAR